MLYRKRSRVIFAVLTKNWPKNIIIPPQTQNYKSDPFDLVALDDHDLTQCKQRLRKVFRSIPDTIHAISAALFQSDMVALPVNPGVTDSKKSNH